MFFDYDFYDSFWDFWRSQVLFYTTWLLLAQEEEARIKQYRAKKRFFVIAHAQRVERIQESNSERPHSRANSMAPLRRIIRPVIVMITIVFRV